MLHEKARFVIVVEGTPIAVRFVPHKTDASKIVLKCQHPEGAAALLLLGGVTPGEMVQGSNFFVTEVSKAEILAAMPKIIGTILETNVPTRDRPPQLALVEDEPEGDDSDESAEN